MRSQAQERTGAAIRKLRLAKGLTLAELSAQCGVPLSTLSRVELGQNALNYDKLVRLCRSLDVDLQGLVTREADATQVASGRRSVTRAGEGAPAKVAAHAARRGAADLLSKAFSPVVLEVTTENLGDHGPMVTLEGEAYGHVLSGAVVFHHHLYAPLSLEAGDGVYFDGRSGHAFTAAGGPARVLLVASGDQTFEG